MFRETQLWDLSQNSVIKILLYWQGSSLGKLDLMGHIHPNYSYIKCCDSRCKLIIYELSVIKGERKNETTLSVVRTSVSLSSTQGAKWFTVGSNWVLELVTLVSMVNVRSNWSHCFFSWNRILLQMDFAHIAFLGYWNCLAALPTGGHWPSLCPYLQGPWASWPSGYGGQQDCSHGSAKGKLWSGTGQNSAFLLS